MKKIAMSVAAATMLMGGLTGCGTDNQATDMNANYNRTGFDAQQMTGTNTGHRGQGPVTDMMTPNTRGGNQGQLGQNRTGFNTTTGPTNYGQRTGFLPQGNNNGTTGLGRTGLFTNDTVTGEQGRTRADQQRITESNRANYGAQTTNRGLFGTQRTGDTNRGLFGTQQRAGTGHSGIVGNNRPGMVDEDGLLRGNARDRAGLTNNRTTRQATLDGQTTRNQTVGQTNRTGRTNMGAQNNGTQGRQGTANYHRDYDSRTAQQIVSRVQNMNGVDDVRVIVHGNDVVVGIDSDNNNAQQVEQKVERKVKGLVKGKDVHVVTDNDTVGQIRTMDDRLRTGAAFEEVGATFNDMINDLARAVQRPFERSR
ncbi:YhcN/YlaJ family sporulation lipoprotein [Halalkalibacter urbisdiaboli]|uniref:YhcN/YlaJ family sporulation lipoprotein n=1 Tax=Halalkalibacter urbisdiaboli TaxID=1960589 RepID=UPI0013FD858C|nr:YhcN/YlaJ family sporulation lipoprotein [Halalkalibacter urbisdiaboli]